MKENARQDRPQWYNGIIDLNCEFRNVKLIWIISLGRVTFLEYNLACMFKHNRQASRQVGASLTCIRIVCLTSC